MLASNRTIVVSFSFTFAVSYGRMMSVFSVWHTCFRLSSLFFKSTRYMYMYWNTQCTGTGTLVRVLPHHTKVEININSIQFKKYILKYIFWWHLLKNAQIFHVLHSRYAYSYVSWKLKINLRWNIRTITESIHCAEFTLVFRYFIGITLIFFSLNSYDSLYQRGSKLVLVIRLIQLYWKLSLNL